MPVKAARNRAHRCRAEYADKSRGKTSRNHHCPQAITDSRASSIGARTATTPADPTKYCIHMEDVRAKMEEKFVFTKKWSAA